MRSYRPIVWIFLAGQFLVLALLALLNVATSPEVQSGTRQWWDASAAFTADRLASTASRVLFHAGISIDPGSTVIGRDGWLFLGDNFSSSISAVRSKATRRQTEAATEIGVGAAAWRDWLAARDVNLFWVLIAPDKDDIYPDYLPKWLRPVSGNRQAAIRAAIDPAVLIDGVRLLRRERPLQPELLFRVTDTHWSNLGAWLATDAFFDRAAAADPTLRFPEGITIGEPSPTPGADLARFIRLADVLTDTSQQIVPVGSAAPQMEQVDYNATVPVTGIPIALRDGKAVLTRTANALNERRVFWVRDSFGTVMASFVYGAFSEVLEFHALSDPARVPDLIARFKPEIVLVTVSDRQSGLSLFRAGPPQ
jgi:alginate O-acetyltransferase complex protein AlgJ